MTLAGRAKRPRRNQINLTLKEASAALLREQAKRLRTTATTLATNLLERALAERVGDNSGEADSLEKLQAEVRALKRAHYNATLKLLQRSGMSAPDIADWAKKRLK